MKIIAEPADYEIYTKRRKHRTSVEKHQKETIYSQ